MFGKPVMAAMSEVAIIGELKIAKRCFCELRLEINRSSAR
jgi:hypothetical protein